ncbi:MAG: DUF309 domain-containing protein [Myxococcota bacterium]
MSSEVHDALSRYARDMERGAYWDAHEHLETLWNRQRHDLWQALIPVAATLVLLGSGRSAGAAGVLARALARLQPLDASTQGVDVDWVREWCVRWLEQLRDGASRVDVQPFLAGLRGALGVGARSCEPSS